MAQSEREDDERHRADRAQPRREEPDQIAAKQQLFAPPGGHRHPQPPPCLDRCVRHQERDLPELGPQGHAGLGGEPRHLPDLQQHESDGSKDDSDSHRQPPAVGQGQTERRPGTCVANPNRERAERDQPLTDDAPPVAANARVGAAGRQVGVKAWPGIQVIVHGRGEHPDREDDIEGDRHVWLRLIVQIILNNPAPGGKGLAGAVD